MINEVKKDSQNGDYLRSEINTNFLNRETPRIILNMIAENLFAKFKESGEYEKLLVMVSNNDFFEDVKALLGEKLASEAHKRLEVGFKKSNK